MGKRTIEKQKIEIEKSAKIDSILKQSRARIKLAKVSKKMKKNNSWLDIIRKLGLEESFVKSNCVRNPEDWKPKSFNEDKQIHDFITFVFCKYTVPPFMYECWFKKYLYHYKPWFLTIAQGGSLYKEFTKEIMSKAATHEFISCPNNSYGINDNIWRAKIKSSGGDEKFICTFIKTGLSSVVKNDKFWDSVVNFFIINPIVNKNDLRDIMDFISYKHRIDNNFSLKGRTINSLISLSNDWHREIIKAKNGGFVAWDGFNIANWSYIHKEKLNGGGTKETFWTIDQIVNSTELFKEGRIMKHCVASYLNYCQKGMKAIFRMRSMNSIEGILNHNVTIEVNQDMCVRQARGKCNISPTRAELFVLEMWRLENNLKKDY